MASDRTARLGVIMSEAVELIFDGLADVVASTVASTLEVSGSTAESERLLTPAEAAQLVAVSPATLVRHGAPSVRVGDQRRYVWSELLAWATAKRDQPAVPDEPALPVRLLSRGGG